MRQEAMLIKNMVNKCLSLGATEIHAYRFISHYFDLIPNECAYLNQCIKEFKELMIYEI